MLNDPFPRQMLLGAKEIRMLLGMGETTWREFLEDPPDDFPVPVDAGKTSRGHARLRWRKSEIYNWIDSRPRLTDWQKNRDREKPRKAAKSRAALPEQEEPE